MFKFLIPVIFGFLASCVGISGNRSTLQEGYAFKITQNQASSLVETTLRAHVASDMMQHSGDLVASGYTRIGPDTHTYTITAVPVPRFNAYGLEVRHHGTRFSGPAVAKNIFEDVIRRALYLGPKVWISPHSN